MSKIIHIIGTGTIGEPLIGLLADYREALGIDEVTFHKRTPIREEIGKVNDLIRRGALLCVDPVRRPQFEELGHTVAYEAMEALERASVVIDCTPAGNRNKKLYETIVQKTKGFIAQGSEKGFGTPYALGINDHALGDEKFIQVVSCNTHNISILLKTLGFYKPGEYGDMQGEMDNCIRKATFVCMRRANDVSQDDSFVASPHVESHGDELYGTHHARDAHDLFETMGWDLRLWSSAVKLPTQYMHALWFSIDRTDPIGMNEIIERLEANENVAMTYKKSSNQVFSFGRDHGYYGRILNQTVVARDTLAINGANEIVGFCFTPQDGNSLMSSVAAALRFVYPKDYMKRLKALNKYLYQEV